MADTGSSSPIITGQADYDAVVVGASLAGCATAIFLGRAGCRVALVEKQPDPDAFKRICSHFIQASAVPTLERLQLLEPILAAGGVRSGFHMWTRWGWVDTPPERASLGVNLRRSLLDPLLRRAAAEVPGVELILGRTAERMLRDERGAVAGVAVHDREGAVTELRAPLTVGADGRDSSVAELAGVDEKVLPHGRFAYGGYFEGEAPENAPDASIWMLDPEWGAAFPTDGGLTFYAAMPTKARLPEFKQDPEAALVSYIESLAEAPPIASSRPIEPIQGKLEMPNRVRATTAPGLALVGDAALATDPLFGIGCGWALQTGEWLADSVAPALRGEETLARGLRRYRRAHKRRLGGHARMIHDYATGRKLNRGERMIFAAAAHDPRVAETFDRFGSRQIGPARMLATSIPRSLLVNLRHRRQSAPEAEPGRGEERAQAALR
ncbi:MAG TPA: NAD(P)/FAD-dependent oxidoreductase [Solirubrobacterales bacterium]|jgi:flavin-dependent dehydrogenase|nr:NAD(P)/FAD-dependent oxidoreductase [Solirubrobacterales bacterium]